MKVQDRLIVEVNERNFESEVLQAQQPVLVDFWAEWCGPCKALTPVLHEIASTYSGRAKVAKVNVDENPNLAQKFGSRSIPTLLYFAEGQLRRQTVGYATKDRIAEDFEAVGLRS